MNIWRMNTIMEILNENRSGITAVAIAARISLSLYYVRELLNHMRKLEMAQPVQHGDVVLWAEFNRALVLRKAKIYAMKKKMADKKLKAKRYREFDRVKHIIRPVGSYSIEPVRCATSVFELGTI